MVTLGLLVMSMAVVQGQNLITGTDEGCARYGGSACCPNLSSIIGGSNQPYSEGPLFVKFLPRTWQNEKIDNVCFNSFLLPDSYTSPTYLHFESKVYSNGEYEINSFVYSQSTSNVLRVGSPICSFADTNFGSTSSDLPNCQVGFGYRCFLYSDCGMFDTVVPVYGLSSSQQPITAECLAAAESSLLSMGFPAQQYLALPMRLPGRCVTSPVCVSTPASRAFRRAAGLLLV